MNYNKFEHDYKPEFTAYKEYPDDPYVAAMCKVKFDKKYTVSYLLKRSKDGGLFWGSPSSALTTSGDPKKTYATGHSFVDSDDEESLKEFIKQNVRRITTGGTHVQMSAPVNQSYAPAPQYQEAVAQEQIPF